jgi:pyridoxal phosphate enzyme (YggS family)
MGDGCPCSGGRPILIAQKLQIIKEKVAAAARISGINADRVQIVAVAKGQGIPKTMEAVQAGLVAIGHNYVQEAQGAVAALGGQGVQMHMIGHLQSNKARNAVELFDVVQTVDNIKLAAALNRHAESTGKIIEVMIQVNLASEHQKSGTTRKGAEDLAEAITSLANIRLVGLMTMPPYSEEPEKARPHFSALRELSEEFRSRGILGPEMDALSMGMSSDYEIAVQEGATMVRIGTLLFGPRQQ